MFIFPESEFTGELLKTRFKVIALPTEIVYPDYYTGEKFDIKDCVKHAFGYNLRDNKFCPPRKVVCENGHFFDYQCLIEIHGNYGDDGHVDYVFRGLARIYRSEIPKTWNEYQKLVERFYIIGSESQESARQLCFKNHFDWECDMPWV